MEGKEREIFYMTQKCYPQTENAKSKRLLTTYINHRKPKELTVVSSRFNLSLTRQQSSPLSITFAVLFELARWFSSSTRWAVIFDNDDGSFIYKLEERWSCLA